MKNQHSFISVFFSKKMWEVRKKIFQIGVGGLLLLFPFFATAAPATSIITPTNDLNVYKDTPVAFSGLASGGVATSTINTTLAPQGLTYASSTTDTAMWVATTDGTTNKVRKFNASTGALMGTYTVGSVPYPVVFASSSNSIWVGNFMDNSVTKLNASTGALIGTYAVGTNPYAGVFDSSTNSVWILNNGGSITKLSATLASPVLGTYTVGSNPQGVTVNPSTSRIYVANASSNTITVLNSTNGALVTTFTSTNVGNGPQGIAYDPSSNSIWVTNFGPQNEVRRLDATSGVLLGTYITGGNTPDFITYDPSLSGVWVTNTDSNSVTLMTALGGVVSTHGVGAYPFPSAFNPKTNSLWVGNMSGNNVTKITTFPITQYEWNEGACTSATLLASSASFSLSTPVLGERRIYFRAKDSSNAWSTNCPYINVNVIPSSIGVINSPASAISVPVGSNVVFSGNGSAGHIIAAQYSTGVNPNWPTFDPVTNSIWVSNFGSDSVSKFNIFNGNKVNVGVGVQPRAIAYDSITPALWVANQVGGSVSKVNMSTNTVTNTYTGVAGSPYGATFDGTSVWITDAFATTLNLNKLNRTTGLKTTYSVGSFPFSVAYDASSSVWTANLNSANVSKFNISASSKVDIVTPASPYAVAFDPVNNFMWSTSLASSTVSRFNITTNARVDYPVGAMPMSLVYASSTNSMWVGNNTSDSVSQINTVSGARTDYFAGRQPLGVAYENITDSLWIANFSKNVITKLNRGGITTYEWWDGGCGTGTFLSNRANFSTSTLAVGTHPVNFRVQDSLSNWSPCTAVNVTVVASTNVATIILPVSDPYSATTETPITFMGGVSGPSPMPTASTTPVGSGSRGVTYEPVTNSIWVTNYNSNTVTKINASTSLAVGTYPAGGAQPWGIAFDSSTNSIWVANYASSSVSKINVNTGAVTGIYATGGTSPSKLAFDSTTNSVWVLNTGTNNISKITASTGALVGTYTTGGSGANGIFFNIESNRIWVTHATAPYGVSKITVHDGVVEATYLTPSGGQPGDMTYDSINNALWIANYGSNNVTKLNAGTGAIIGYYGAGPKPTGIVFDPNSLSVFVSNADATNSTITRLNSMSGANIGTTYQTPGTTPSALVYNPATSSLWVTNTSTTNVAKLDAGVIVDYEWREGACSTGPVMVTGSPASFITWLPAGTHTIYFRGKDATGAWSSCDSQVVNVVAPPLSTITAPSAPVTVDAGTSVAFAGNVTSALDGPLTPLTPATLATGSTPQGSVLSPDGKWFYVVNLGSDSISKYQRNSTTGALSSDGNFLTADRPIDITISPDGTSLYVVNNNPDAAISKYARNPSDGTLSLRLDYTLGYNPNASSVTISPDGKFVYVTSPTPDIVSKYIRNLTTGELSGKVDYVTGANPGEMAISPDGKSLYVTNNGSNTVSMYARDLTTGTLSPKIDSTTGPNPLSVAVSPDGLFVYVVGPDFAFPSSPDTVSMYARNPSDGTLSLPTFYPTGDLPIGLAIAPDGKTLYVTNSADNTISKYDRDLATGVLSPKTDYAVSVSPYGIALSADSVSLYGVSNILGSIAQFKRSAINLYEWCDGACAPATLLSNNPQFNTTSLSSGLHTINFRGQDANNVWSSPDTVSVTVNPGPACGSAATPAPPRTTAPTEPPDELCSIGTAGPVSGNTTIGWTWGCTAGTSISCQVNSSVMNGDCGTAWNVATSTAPADPNLCDNPSTSVSSPATLGDPENGPWQWQCNGTNGGNIASCTAPFAAVCGDNVCRKGEETFLNCAKDCRIKLRQF